MNKKIILKALEKKFGQGFCGPKARKKLELYGISPSFNSSNPNNFSYI